MRLLQWGSEMPIEQFDNIDDLDPLNPLDDDPVSEGDDHLRGIKNALQGNVTGDALETRLMVASIIRAFVDANRFTAIDELAVKGDLIDIDHSAFNLDALLTIRNNIGAIRMIIESVAGSAKLQQAQSDGVSTVKTWLAFARNGGVASFFNDLVAMQTVDTSAANSSAEIFDSLENPKPVGFNSLVQIATPGTFTVSNAENGTRQRTGNVGITITLPNSALVNGWTMILQKGTVTGVAFDTISAPGTLRWYKGDEIATGNRQLQQGGICTIAQNSTGVYDIWGNGLS